MGWGENLLTNAGMPTWVAGTIAMMTFAFLLGALAANFMWTYYWYNGGKRNKITRRF